MSDTMETVPLAVPRDRSVEARHAKRQAKASRERRIIASLNRGVPVAVIAEWEDVGEKRMRTLVRDILARRMPEPPVQFLAMQVSRLNEALLVSFDAMSGSNLQAVDRVVKIVRALDRYHGFAATGRGALTVASKSPKEIPHGSRRTSLSGVARKWRRKALKRLNPRPEMVWPRRHLTPKLWYKARRRRFGSRPRRPNPSRDRGAAGQLEKTESTPEMVWLRKARAPKIWRRRAANHSSSQPPRTRAAPDG